MDVISGDDVWEYFGTSVKLYLYGGRQIKTTQCIYVQRSFIAF